MFAKNILLFLACVCFIARADHFDISPKEVRQHYEMKRDQFKIAALEFKAMERVEKSRQYFNIDPTFFQLFEEFLEQRSKLVHNYLTGNATAEEFEQLLLEFIEKTIAANETIIKEKEDIDKETDLVCSACNQEEGADKTSTEQ